MYILNSLLCLQLGAESFCYTVKPCCAFEALQKVKYYTLLFEGTMDTFRLPLFCHV